MSFLDITNNNANNIHIVQQQQWQRVRDNILKNQTSNTPTTATTINSVICNSKSQQQQLQHTLSTTTSFCPKKRDLSIALICSVKFYTQSHRKFHRIDKTRATLHSEDDTTQNSSQTSFKISSNTFSTNNRERVAADRWGQRHSTK